MSSSTSNSKRLPKTFLLAAFLILLTISAMVYYLKKTEAIPAPMFTGRLSVDEKIRFVRINHPIKADLVVMGSSTGLNNISSEVIFDRREIGKSYFNYSAWGLNISQMLDLWHFFGKLYTPKVIILYITVFDFRSHEKIVLNENDLRNYVEGGASFPYYFKYHKTGLGERMRTVGRKRRTKVGWDSLKYDAGGGASFNIPEEKFEQNDWPDRLTEDYFVEEQYGVLNKMLKIFNEDNIYAVIVQGPLREQYSESNEKYAFLKKHWERVEAIAEENDMLFLNMHGLFYPDESLFPDTIHLNREGAQRLTKELLRQMEEKQVFQKLNK